MSYALNAVFTLPQFMAASKIAEVNVGRFNMIESALTGSKEAMANEPRLVTCVRGVLEFELNIPVTVSYIIVTET